MKATFCNPRNGAVYSLDEPRWRADDGAPIIVSARPGISRQDIESGTRSLWRYRAAFAAEIRDPICLGEGGTPLVQKRWGALQPHFKLEWFNPTGSFKDRGASVMLSFVRSLGIDAVLEDSSGNGGAAVAAFGAAGGMKIKIIAPTHTSAAKIAQVRAYGAEVQLVEGPREEAEAEAIRQSQHIFYASHNWHPFFLEGTKTLAYELWEDFGFDVPDNIVMPVGAGSSLLGCHFGFKELMAAGQIDKLPRLFAAQPLNCSPIDASFEAGLDTLVPREVRRTIAEGTAIKKPIRLAEIVASLRETGGRTVAITEAEIVDALKRLGALGFFVEPTCATAAAALDKLTEAGLIAADERTVVILTGTGLKAAVAIAELV